MKNVLNELDDQARIGEVISWLVGQDKQKESVHNAEADHLWTFFSKASSKPVAVLQQHAKTIIQNENNPVIIERECCELLGIPSNTLQISPEKLKKQLAMVSTKSFDSILTTDGYTLRWIYYIDAYEESIYTENKIGRTLRTLRNDKGTKYRTENIQALKKRAAFSIKDVKNGTPNIWSDEVLDTSPAKLTKL